MPAHATERLAERSCEDRQHRESEAKPEAAGTRGDYDEAEHVDEDAFGELEAIVHVSSFRRPLVREVMRSDAASVRDGADKWSWPR